MQTNRLQFTSTPYSHNSLKWTCVIIASHQNSKRTSGRRENPVALIPWAPMADTKPRIDLIPWDFNSEEHQQRMYLQRLACGWRSDEIQKWAELGRAGKKTLYWIVSSITQSRKGADLRSVADQESKGAG